MDEARNMFFITKSPFYLKKGDRLLCPLQQTPDFAASAGVDRAACPLF
jgi:hypothetical protein